MNLFSSILYFDCDFYFRFVHMLKFSHLLTLGIFLVLNEILVFCLKLSLWFVSLGSEGFYRTLYGLISSQTTS